MKTELVQHTGINLATKKEQVFKQYFVHYDGKRVGLIGWEADSKLVFTATVSPFDKSVILSQVAKLIEREAEYVNAPTLIDQELEEPQTESINNEFDESDLT
jgi:hypothetical protein